MEDYLRIDDESIRKQLTLLRYGGHQLRVSQARFGKNRLEHNDRICQVCEHMNGECEVEDERHLICKCPAYAEEREKLSRRLIRANLPDITASDEKLLSAVMHADVPLLSMSCTRQKCRMVLMYCRDFLTTILRLRKRYLTHPSRVESDGAQVVHHDSFVSVYEQDDVHVQLDLELQLQLDLDVDIQAEAGVGVHVKFQINVVDRQRIVQ